MWRNDKNDKSLFKKELFVKANDIVNNYTILTPLKKLEILSKTINKTVYIKDESYQNTNSFKMRGISYDVHNKVEELDNINKYNNNNKISLITQSTGNHGIALLYTLYEIAKQNKNNKNHVINKIKPIIFASKDIGKLKHKKMLLYLDMFINELNIVDKENKDELGQVITNFETYGEALKKREEYIKNNESYYIAHASNDIMIGHGSIGIEIKEQLEELGYDDNTKICFLCACGAGGPVGMGSCLKEIYPKDNINFVIVQTHDQNALILSLLQNKIVYNNEIDDIMPFNYADGIGVDKPEEDTLEASRVYCDGGITVNHYETLLKSTNFIKDLSISHNKEEKECVAGGSTTAVYLAIEKLKDNELIKNSDIIIMLGCEGNVDNNIKDYINKL